ncbi:BRISC and BRCA1-A complex member 1-like [Trichogramma pretiosum]|uniref:BRISC and BRCA1-A complex member 1-like n=1 Tax=Trichogramma pretiosum TaxID=7493 RepID=UPI0006C9D12C|nr:BRISC and BRCA1-A complex member 1-like [Trichogramma pretiosum]
MNTNNFIQEGSIDASSEKIIFVIDLVCEFGSDEIVKSHVLYMIKRAIEIFVHIKLDINANHKFAFITIDSNGAKWICNFSSDSKILMNALEDVEQINETEPVQYFEVDSIFNVLSKQLNLHEMLTNNAVRLILLYSRSFTLPKINTANLQKMIKYQHFFIDILYIHDPELSNSKCKEIHAQLSKLITNSNSYNMKSSYDPVDIHNFMSKLLSHPLQRICGFDKMI